ncbi:MAG: ATP-dependent RecD-like DNA helicase [Ruminococcaceae bacterium]|nr:ATP-dependent RecD-like DNA helicase [Oscillospiraceae bacterium]
MQGSIDSEKMQKLSGTVKKITFQNQSNWYTVAELSADKENITVVGILPFLNEGDIAEFTGKFIVHSTYGRQFSCESFEKRAPENSAAILRYLSAGAIKGIGPSTALKIVERFGEDSLNVISERPQELIVIKGISLQKAMQISEEYKKQYGIKDIMLMLSKYKVSPERCLKIYKKFGSKSVDIITQNPYVLCEEGLEFGFEICEDIAADLGFQNDNEFRICAGIEYVLRKNLYNGHTCLPRDKFIPVACKLLEAKESTVEICCDRLIECFRISNEFINGKEYVSIPDYRAAEQFIAARLLSVKNHINSAVTVDELEIQNVENRLGIKFEDLQREAITEAFKSGILVLTGGPGTGKTTTLNAIIKLFEGRNFEIELAAPTGRAAKRMTELTGRESKTIHRLLEVEWSDGEKRRFSRNERNPLNCDVIIVDEASMIDAILFSDLLKALKLSCRIILVGDSDQLPSIGAGNVLGDILSSEAFPSIRLKKIFRQAEKSKIITNAHAIINNEKADFDSKDSDFFFLQRNDKYSALETVIDLVTERLPSAYGVDSIKDIQLLCPSRMMDLGTVNLNNLLQERLNPHKKGNPQLFFKGFYFRVNDKVMQIKNNYDLQYRKDNGEIGLGVFNGDVGYITDIDIRANILKVRFEDRTVTYFPEDLGQLELAYAVTVHKSQGSEYDYVVLPLFDVPSKLKYRNLLYTAVTRAKKMLIVVGLEQIWNEMAANDKKTLRYTMLSTFIEEGKR